jgi:hypothetical protein
MLTLAGRVVFVHRGEILGDGTHESLLQTCPLYARSYEEWQAEEEAEQRQAAEQAGPPRARQARWG